MDENTHRLWDIIFKWLGIVGVLCGAGWTLWTFQVNRTADEKKEARIRQEDTDSRTRDQNKFIFERQASLYFEASRSAAILAIATDSRRKKSIEAKTLNEAKERFEELYWGELVAVEDRRVEMAMVAFRNCLIKSGEHCERISVNQDAKRINHQTLARLGEPTLPNLSLELAACMRSALQDDRGIDFGDLKNGDLEGEQRKISSVCPYD